MHPRFGVCRRPRKAGRRQYVDRQAHGNHARRGRHRVGQHQEKVRRQRDRSRAVRRRAERPGPTRIAVRGGRYEAAAELLEKIDVSALKRAEVVNDVEFYKAPRRCAWPCPGRDRRPMPAGSFSPSKRNTKPASTTTKPARRWATCWPRSANSTRPNRSTASWPPPPGPITKSARRAGRPRAGQSEAI